MLELTNVTFDYPATLTGKTRHGVRDLSLCIREGETFGYLGHNGAGKTTTIKCILDLIHPTSGTITIAGVDSRSHKARRLVGYLPEQPYFYDHLTVQESVYMYAQLSGLSRSAARPATARALERIQLTGRAGNKLRTLSKGLVQRVALAQALVASPRLLILDEPFSGLDPLGRKEFREILLELRQEGITIFMCSHVLSDVEQLCDRVSIMAHGELRGVFELTNLPKLASETYELVVNETDRDLEPLMVGASAWCKERGQVRFSFRECVQAQAALRKSIELNLAVVSYHHSRGTLEDLFTSIVTSQEVKE